MTTKRFFGKYLRIHIALLRAKVGSDFDQILKEHDVRDAEELESGNWTNLDRNSLFVLLSLSQAHGASPLLEAAQSPLWETFHKTFQKPLGYVVPGTNKSGSQIEADLKVAASLMGADLHLKMKLVNDNVSEQEVRSWMSERNVIFVGGPKANRATDICLNALWQGQTMPIYFRWPDHDRKSSISGPSKTQQRGLRIGTREMEETDKKKIGVIVVCRDPLGGKNVTTMVLAGCSREATEKMSLDLHNSEFYYQFPAKLDQKMIGQPQMFLFNSDNKPRRWEAIGVETIPKKRGRKSGKTRNTRFRASP